MRVERAVPILALLLAVAGGGCKQSNSPTPTLAATCSAAPAAGVAPLTVAFNVNVSGADGRFTVTASYGDGATGTNPDATHIYAAPGVFTASFTVSTSSQSARCATSVTVSGSGVVPTPSPLPTQPTPTPSTNYPPRAVLKTNPPPDADNRITGVAPFAVSFNMCPTEDPENDRLRYTMDFEGDGKLDIDSNDSADCRHTKHYSAGAFRPRICVTDEDASGQQLHTPQCASWKVEVE